MQAFDRFQGEEIGIARLRAGEIHAHHRLVRLRFLAFDPAAQFEDGTVSRIERFRFISGALTVEGQRRLHAVFTETQIDAQRAQ